MCNGWLLPILALSAWIICITGSIVPDYSAYAEAVCFLIFIQFLRTSSSSKSAIPSPLSSLHQSPVIRLNENEESEYVEYCEQQPVITRTYDLTYLSRSRSLYWAQQQSSIQSVCYFRARNAQDVAMLVSVSRSSRCPFAIRGGGHSDIPGASNSPRGITLDLAGLKGIEVVEDEHVGRLGGGLT